MNLDRWRWMWIYQGISTNYMTRTGRNMSLFFLSYWKSPSRRFRRVSLLSGSYFSFSFIIFFFRVAANHEMDRRKAGRDSTSVGVDGILLGRLSNVWGWIFDSMDDDAKLLMSSISMICKCTWLTLFRKPHFRKTTEARSIAGLSCNMRALVLDPEALARIQCSTIAQTKKT